MLLLKNIAHFGKSKHVFKNQKKPNLDCKENYNATWRYNTQKENHICTLFIGFEVHKSYKYIQHRKWIDI